MTTETTPPVVPPSKPKRRFGVGALVAASALGAVLTGGGILAFLRHGAAHAPAPGEATAVAQRKPQYQCPMHPTIVQDHPGECPICGMKLVETGAPTGDKPKAEGQPGQR